MAGIRALLRNFGGPKRNASGPLVGCRRWALPELSRSPVGLRNWQRFAAGVGADGFSSRALKVSQDGQAQLQPGPGVRRLSSGMRKVIHGKYEILTMVGSGAFGTVFRGRDVQTGEPVAIKRLDRDDMEDPDDRSKLSHHEELVTREILALMAVRHPYITRLYDVSATIRHIYLVMEYMPGGDLQNRVEQKGRFDDDEGRTHFQHLIDAVHFCHSRGIYHRDLKPENLLLDASNNLKVSDFGLAGLKELSDTSLKGPHMQSQAGSQPYMAPEVIFKKGNVGYLGPPNDTWACGVILFIFLAGYHPFWDSNQSMKLTIKNIQTASYQCPAFISSGARSLISRILDVNSRTRITTQDIYKDPWFKTNYVPPDFHQIGEVHSSLQNIDNIFRHPEVAAPSARPASFSAFDLLSQQNPVDDALAPYFNRLGRDTTVKQETRFTTQLPPNDILHLIGRTVKVAGYHVQRRAFTIKIDNDGIAGNKEPLCVTAEVFELGSHKGPAMLVLTKITGNPGDYREFVAWLSQEMGNRMVEVW